jgi:putative ABC transport system permease protein
MLSDFFRLSVNNLRRRKLRSWLTMLGIFIGIASVVALISLGQGLQTAITGQFSTLGTDFLTIQNAGTGFGPPGSTVVEKLNEHDLKIIGEVRGVKEAVSRLIRIVEIEYNGASSFNYIGDVPEDKSKMNMVYNAGNLEVESGRLLETGDKGKIIIGPNIAKKENFGKEIFVGKKIKVQGEYFEVIGILKRGSSFQVNDVIIMLNSDMKNILEIDNEIDLIVAKVEDTETPEIVADRIEQALRKDRNEKVGEEDFSVQTPLEAISAVNQILIAINVVVIGIAMISIFVGGIGIANTMYTSVLERKKEIGTMKAIGARNSNVLTIFLIEAGLLGFVGGAIGVGIGLGIAFSVSSIANSVFGSNILAVKLSIPLISFAMGFSFLIGILSGFFPSYQASRLSPVEALRS